MKFLSLSRKHSSARNVSIDEERGETDVFAGYMLLHDSGNHSGFMWEQQPRFINQHLFTMATSLVRTDIVETRKTLYPPLT